MLGNLGMTELIIILVIVLVLFGAKRVPEIGASIGKGIRDFKRSVNDVDRQIREPERDAGVDRIATGDRAPRASEAAEEDVRPEPRRLL